MKKMYEFSSRVLYACPGKKKKTMKFTLSINCEQINRERYLSRGKYLGIEIRNLDADCNNIVSRTCWFWVFSTIELPIVTCFTCFYRQI